MKKDLLLQKAYYMGCDSNNENGLLLRSFNQRDPYSFGIIYRMIYRELHLYATHLTRTLDLSAEDMIQDIFTDIWLRESVQFPSILYIKTFCFIALKNAYKNKIKHQGYQQRFELECKVEKEFTDDIEQVELYHTLYESLKFLPVDYATVIRMYLEGWKPEEIATKLGLALQTVYNKRREAIVILRKYMMK